MVYVLCGHPCVYIFWWIVERIRMRSIKLSTGIGIVGIAIEQEAGPAVVDDQIGAVALAPIARSDLEARLVSRADQGEDVPEYSVFTILGEVTEFDVVEREDHASLCKFSV